MSQIEQNLGIIEASLNPDNKAAKNTRNFSRGASVQKERAVFDMSAQLAIGTQLAKPKSNASGPVLKRRSASNGRP